MSVSSSRWVAVHMAGAGVVTEGWMDVPKVLFVFIRVSWSGWGVCRDGWIM
jgi:hypothetical protein